MATTASMSSWFGPFGPGRRPHWDENSRRYFRFLNRLCKCSKVEGFSTMAERRMRAGLMKRMSKPAANAIRGAQVGPTLAPAMEDKQLMADHRRFGNHGPESPWFLPVGPW